MVTRLNCNVSHPGNDKICRMTKFVHIAGCAHECFDGSSRNLGARIVAGRQKMFDSYPLDLFVFTWGDQV